MLARNDLGEERITRRDARTRPHLPPPSGARLFERRRGAIPNDCSGKPQTQKLSQRPEPVCSVHQSNRIGSGSAKRQSGRRSTVRRSQPLFYAVVPSRLVAVPACYRADLVAAWSTPRGRSSNACRQPNPWLRVWSPDSTGWIVAFRNACGSNAGNGSLGFRWLARPSEAESGLRVARVQFMGTSLYRASPSSQERMKGRVPGRIPDRKTRPYRLSARRDVS